MTTTFRIFSIIIPALLTGAASCKKDKKHNLIPEPPADGQEVITTFKINFRDSITGTETSYFFKDPDGEGGAPAFFGPTADTQSDSVIKLSANTTYLAEIKLLDETKNPAEDISAQVSNEGNEHMFFYGQNNNTILNAAVPYTVRLNGSNIKIIYTDLDSGTPQRNIGLKTTWKSGGTTGTIKYPVNITLKHQPGAKDGTFAPGESDISVDFKITVI